jgi:hypothetical protein
MATRDPFPVLCDRCRAEGLAGEAGFERLAGLGDLLDFEPVPRRVPRADGWTPEIQRAYVAALAVTGSERQAAAAVERAQFGVTQLRRAEGNEGFLAACDKAMEIWRERERVRRSDNLLAAAEGEAARTRPRLAWSGAATRRLPPPDPPLDPEAEEKAAFELLEFLARGIWIKLRDERKARLEGRIVAADFYLRQITWLEVALDLASDDSIRMWKELERAGTHVIHVAATPISRILDAARRLAWGEAAEPDRPDPPEPPRLVDHGGFFTEPHEHGQGDPAESVQERWRRFDEQHEIEAKAQVEWEAKALRESAEWRARLEREAEASRDDERRRDGDSDS